RDQSLARLKAETVGLPSLSDAACHCGREAAVTALLSTGHRIPIACHQNCPQSSPAVGAAGVAFVAFCTQGGVCRMRPGFRSCGLRRVLRAVAQAAACCATAALLSACNFEAQKPELALDTPAKYRWARGTV